MDNLLSNAITYSPHGGDVHYGVPADENDLALAIPDTGVPAGATIIHPGAKSPSRRWPTARYAAVARRLQAAGHQVVITGSAAGHLAVRVAADAELPDDTVLPTTLDELAGLVAHARLLISGDTGIAHLATAYGTPSVVLFGPMSPARWGPPADRPRNRPIWHGTRRRPRPRPPRPAGRHPRRSSHRDRPRPRLRRAAQRFARRLTHRRPLGAEPAAVSAYVPSPVGHCDGPAMAREGHEADRGCPDGEVVRAATTK